MGAWIEIANGVAIIPSDIVAPLVGAWIEIIDQWLELIGESLVAPLVGAWIEIL